MFEHTTLAETLRAQDATASMGLEDNETVAEFFDRKVGGMYHSIEKLIKGSKRPVASRPESARAAMVYLDTLGVEDRDALDAFRVANMAEYQTAWSKELLRQVKMIGDLETRLYLPIVEWTGKVLNDFESANKAWTDRRISKLDTKLLQLEISKNFDGRGTKTGDPSTTTFGEMYANVKDLERSENTLVDLFNAANMIDLTRLRDYEEDIGENINKITALYEEGELEISEGQLTNFISIVHSTAAETEHMVALLTYAQLTIATHNVNVETYENLANAK